MELADEGVDDAEETLELLEEADVLREDAWLDVAEAGAEEFGLADEEFCMEQKLSQPAWLLAE